MQPISRPGKRSSDRLKDVLGTEDPVLSRMAALMTSYDNTFAAIDAFIERGKLIEEFDPEMLKQMIETLEVGRGRLGLFNALQQQRCP